MGIRQTISAIQISVEQSIFNDDGKHLPRPKPEMLVFFEAEIPDPIMDWLREQLAKRGA